MTRRAVTLVGIGGAAFLAARSMLWTSGIAGLAVAPDAHAATVGFGLAFLFLVGGAFALEKPLVSAIAFLLAFLYGAITTTAAQWSLMLVLWPLVAVGLGILSALNLSDVVERVQDNGGAKS